MVRDLGHNFTSLSGLVSQTGSSILAHGRCHLMVAYIISWHLEGFTEETVKYWVGPGPVGLVPLMACTMKEASLSRALPNRWCEFELSSA